jgi:hypothetical protein
LEEETRRTSNAETDWCMKNWLVAVSVAMLGAAVFVSPAQAQRHGGASAPAGRNGMALSRGGGMRTGVGRLRRGHRFSGNSGFGPYFDDYDYGYDSGYDSDQGAAQAPPPQVIVGQAGQPSSPAPVPEAPESLVLELHGDHYVRVTNYGESQSQPETERTSNPTSAVPPANPRRTQAAEPPRELPPAALVFRDGHEEAIGKYMIVGTTIYTSADYWSSGSWTRKVQIAELDVPATLKLNQERGARFSLPSGPNEVMIRQ